MVAPPAAAGSGLRRRVVGILIPALLAPACSSARDTEKRAFLAAGLELQRQAPEPSFDDLRIELDLYLNDELMDLKDRAKRQEEKELDLYRKVALIGSGAAVLAISSGTLNDPGTRELPVHPRRRQRRGRARRFRALPRSHE